MDDTFQHIGDLAMSVIQTNTNKVWAGKQITEQGVYAGIPIEDYHSNIDLFDSFSISSSGLRQVIKRPSEYWAFSPYNIDRFERTTTDALNFGSAAHMLLLGEKGFASRFALRPENINGKGWQGNRSDCKEWIAEMKRFNKTVITQSELDAITYMTISLSHHPMIKLGILNGQIERSIVYRHENIWIKARPDVVPTQSGDFADLKTATDLSDEALSRTIFKHGYHVQAAVVRMAVRAVVGEEAFKSFTFVFVEKTPPYDVRVMQLKDADIDLGERQARQAIKLIQQCLKAGEWPGYDGFSPSADWIEMPSWARTHLENEMNAQERAA